MNLLFSDDPNDCDASNFEYCHLGYRTDRLALGGICVCGHFEYRGLYPGPDERTCLGGAMYPCGKHPLEIEFQGHFHKLTSDESCFNGKCDMLNIDGDAMQCSFDGLDL